MFLYLVFVVSLSLAPALAGKNCAFGNGWSYRGSISTTVGGLPCQRWDRQYPHQHDRTPSNYPSSGLAENYCRNPDDEPYPWCYTTSSKRWDFCGVPACLVDVYCFTGKGEDYRGTKRETDTGKTCQQWDSQYPHEHTRTRLNYPLSGLDSNYCRNPDGESRLWCYTTDPSSRWEYCTTRPCHMG